MKQYITKNICENTLYTVAKSPKNIHRQQIDYVYSVGFRFNILNKSILLVLVNHLIAFCLFQIRALYKYNKLIASEKDAGLSPKNAGESPEKRWGEPQENAGVSLKKMLEGAQKEAGVSLKRRRSEPKKTLE